MVSFQLAYTTPINPPSATPIVTAAQAWAGLERKVQHAEEFISVISSTHVLEETVDPTTKSPVVLRDVVRKDGQRAQERCVLSPPTGTGCKLDVFVVDDGSHIENIVSTGPLGELYMTFTFDILNRDLEDGDAAGIRKAREGYQSLAKFAVEGTVNSIRAMVTDGRVAS